MAYELKACRSFILGDSSVDSINEGMHGTEFICLYMLYVARVGERQSLSCLCIDRNELVCDQRLANKLHRAWGVDHFLDPFSLVNFIAGWKVLI